MQDCGKHCGKCETCRLASPRNKLLAILIAFLICVLPAVAQQGEYVYQLNTVVPPPVTMIPDLNTLLVNTPLNCQGYSTAIIEVLTTGAAGVGTSTQMSFESSIDGVTWVTAFAQDITSDSAQINGNEGILPTIGNLQRVFNYPSMPGNRIYRMNVAAITYVRVVFGYTGTNIPGAGSIVGVVANNIGPEYPVHVVHDGNLSVQNNYVIGDTGPSTGINATKINCTGYTNCYLLIWGGSYTGTVSYFAQNGKLGASSFTAPIIGVDMSTGKAATSIDVVAPAVKLIRINVSGLDNILPQYTHIGGALNITYILSMGNSDPVTQSSFVTGSAVQLQDSGGTNLASISAAGAVKVDGSAVTQPINTAQINGVAPSMGNGVSGTGVQRVTLASDSTGQVTLAAGAATIGALTANQSVNLNQLSGSAISVGRGVSGTGTIRAVRPEQQTYSACSTAFTPGATPQDVFTITGSGTKTVTVLRVGFTATQTAYGTNDWFLVKRSSANSGGTSASCTAVPLDSNNSAATATVLQYTVNPTAGSLVGNLRHHKISCPAPTTTGGAIQPPEILYDSNVERGQPITLRGTGEVLALNFNGAALPAGLSLALFVEWTEE